MTSDMQQVIAGRLREARQLAGLSQGQVAKMLDMHRPSVTAIEAATRRVSAEELSRFAEIYDVSLAYLTGEVPDTVGLDDPRLQLAARELGKLPPESLDQLLKALAALRDDAERTG
jgi:transcriptional regulator with XRE-family HTH domain